jgi:sporulation protein YlmC with PRC-barrel domain
MLKSYVFAGALVATMSGAVLAQQMNRPGGAMDRPATGPERSTDGTMRGPGAGSMDQSATGAPQFLSTLPQNALLVSNIHNQNVYDRQDNKLGEVKDLVVDRSGRINAAVLSVGGFLGIGEKDVAVAFSDLQAVQTDNNKWRLTLNVSKDALKNATGFRYDKNKGLWTLGSVK